MRRHIILLLSFLFVMSYQQTQAQDLEAFSREIFQHGQDTLRYRLLTPANYDMHKAYPLFIFLHGSGERGYDNNAQLLHGGALFVKDSIRTAFPAFILFPQCPPGKSWAPMRLKRDSTGRVISAEFSTDEVPTKPGELVKLLLDSLAKTGKIDTRKIYVGGLSLGGMGTVDLIARYPNTFAAAVDICGAGNVQQLARLPRRTPLWIFHGADDQVVPVAASRSIYEELKRLKSEVKYTEYPGVGHNSWDNAFVEPELLPWLFSHKMKK